MLKKIAWNTFKNTGSIDTMMELLEVKNIEKNIQINSNDSLNIFNDSKLNDNIKNN